jgi:ATP-dependent Clp protease ATP-binding subunit ClpC
MPAYHFPILICESHDGVCTAALIEDAGATSAVALRAGDAIDQIKDVLEYRLKLRTLAEPELIDAECSMVRVDVRSEYREADERTFACQETIPLRIPCVRCKDDGGMLICVLPTLGLRFSYYDKEAFKGLVAYTVQSRLKGRTPQQIGEMLPPRQVSIENVVIQVPANRRRKIETRKLTVLPTVADPLASRQMRRGFSRPWERDQQVAEVVRFLQKEKSSLLLVGESGVGKTAIIAEAVRKVQREGLEQEQETDRALDADLQAVPRFWLTSASRLIAGMKYLGMWEQRVEAIIAELAEIHGVLCVESLLDLVQVGGHGPIDSIAAFLIPYLQRRELRLIAEATPSELDACRRLLPGLADVLGTLIIEPMDRRSAISALEHIAEQQSQNLRIEFDRGVAESVYRLFGRFMPYQGFPGPAAGFTVELFESGARDRAARVNRDRVIQRFVRQSGLPELFLRDEMLLDEAEVVATLQRRVIGQEAACRTAAQVITTTKAGMNDPARPISVMLFCGPTGVGKTELARSMADFHFGHGEQRDRMIRLDMSEYSGFGAAERLLTDARGGPSELLKRIRQQPFNLVLLDEIEKASPQVFDVLLGLFDEGRLSDRFGRLTIFRSAVIIMTSNLGADRAEPFGLSRTAAATHESEAAAFFRPEFVNRIDTIVNFQPLQPDSIRRICIKELTDLRQREGLVKNNLQLTWTDAVVDHLAEHGFDRRYGARPLQRAIEKRIVIPLSRELIAHPEYRDQTLRIDIGPNEDVCFRALAR